VNSLLVEKVVKLKKEEIVFLDERVCEIKYVGKKRKRNEKNTNHLQKAHTQMPMFTVEFIGTDKIRENSGENWRKKLACCFLC